MMTPLNEAIFQLSYFLDEDIDNKLIQFKPDKPLKVLISNLKQLEQQHLKNAINSQFLEELRADLNYILKQEKAYYVTKNLKKRGIVNFDYAIHCALIAIAELSPINEVDDVSLEEIPEERRIVFSSGRQYDLESLLNYHIVRVSKSLNEDSVLGKPLQLTSHGGEMNYLDVKHFQKTLRRMNIKLPPLKKEGLLAFTYKKMGHALFNEVLDLLLPSFFREKNWAMNNVLKEIHLTEEEFNRLWKPFNNHISYNFSHKHADALIYLIQVQQLSKNAAFSEINELTEGQAYVLHKLYSKGILGETIKQSWDNDVELFSMNHANTLIFLMTEVIPPLSFDEAILELDQLNHDEAMVLKSLYGIGLRGKHFSYRTAPKPVMNTQHVNLLHRLIQEHQLSPQEAIQESNTLSAEQAEFLSHMYVKGVRGIQLRRFTDDWTEDGYGQLFGILTNKEGLSIDDCMTRLTTITNEQAKTLVRLHASGLRCSHFENWRGDWRDEIHGELINALIKKDNFSVEQALAVLPTLDKIEDAIPLSRLYHYGIRPADFAHHRDAILYSCEQKGIEEYVSDFMAQNNSTALSVITDINELNEQERITLRELYGNGLRAQHLRSSFPRKQVHDNFEAKRKLFGELHRDALTHFICTENKSPEEACDILKGKTREQILDCLPRHIWWKHSKNEVMAMTVISLLALYFLPSSVSGALALLAVAQVIMDQPQADPAQINNLNQRLDPQM